jgi:hypothetical protein
VRNLANRQDDLSQHELPSSRSELTQTQVKPAELPNFFVFQDYFSGMRPWWSFSFAAPCGGSDLPSPRGGASGAGAATAGAASNISGSGSENACCPAAAGTANPPDTSGQANQGGQAGDNSGFLNAGADSSKYNAATARYQHLSDITGLGISVDTSFGASQASDSWSATSSDELSDRIAEGVIAVNVTQPPDDYQSRVEQRGGLPSTCQ